MLQESAGMSPRARWQRRHIRRRPARAITGAPTTTERRKNQPINDPTSGLNALETKWDTPPELGNLIDKSPIVSAMGMTSRLISTQASNDAGPAESATTPGRNMIPDPSTAPI